MADDSGIDGSGSARYARVHSPDRCAARTGRPATSVGRRGIGDRLRRRCHIRRQPDFALCSKRDPSRRFVDAEGALRRTNNRFYRRFATMEGLCRERDISFPELPPDEKEALWQEAKGR